MTIINVLSYLSETCAYVVVKDTGAVLKMSFFPLLYTHIYSYKWDTNSALITESSKFSAFQPRQKF